MKQLFESTKSILQSTFGYNSFRPLQEECIRAVLGKKDTLLIMPTGGGKSLCYQIPALIFPGLTIVISPLISLMKDQVNQLNDLGIEAKVLNSSLTWEEYNRNLETVQSGQTKLLFMAPETLLKDDILMMLSRLHVDCVTIDEAHCISDWGHDFRPEYRQLKDVRGNFPHAVYLAMTATATPRVGQDIIQNLGLHSQKVLIASFNRKNLFYEVIPKTDPVEQSLDFLHRFKDQSGIIYCFSRKQVDVLTYEINQKGFKALPYHAGLSNHIRDQNQDLFIRDDVQIMVATIAFGMGINKPNVRFVIHFDLPKSIESYYQETGRAGRDGLPAHCLLLFGYGDIGKISYLIDQKSDDKEKRIAHNHLNAVVQYGETEICRRILLMKYFGDAYTQKQCELCDNCVNPKNSAFDITMVAQKFLLGVWKTGQRFGAVHVIDVLRGSKSQKVLNYYHNKLDVYGTGREFSLRQWQFLARQFLQKDLICKEEEYSVLKLTPLAWQVIKDQDKVQGYLPPTERIRSRAAKKTISYEKCDQSLLEILRKKRKQLADRKGVPPYVIFPDKSLIDMTSSLPQTKKDFSMIFGVGLRKLETYGDIFVDIIRDYCHQEGKVSDSYNN